MITGEKAEVLQIATRRKALGMISIGEVTGNRRTAQLLAQVLDYISTQ
jgi:hypothetical protein